MEEIFSFTDFETRGSIQLLKTEEGSQVIYLLSDTRVFWENNDDDIRNSLLLITSDRDKMKDTLLSLISSNPSYTLYRDDGKSLSNEEITELLQII